jgi:uncharacterized membrane protein
MQIKGIRMQGQESMAPTVSKSRTPTWYSIAAIICGILCFIFTGIIFVVVGVIGFGLGVQAVKVKDKLGYIALPIAILGWAYTLWLTAFVM